jgi:hypothetical protein
VPVRAVLRMKRRRVNDEWIIVVEAFYLPWHRGAMP